jgi:hypothetical protein
MNVRKSFTNSVDDVCKKSVKVSFNSPVPTDQAGGSGTQIKLWVMEADLRATAQFVTSSDYKNLLYQFKC